MSQSTAIYVGWCAACSNTSAVPWDLATRSGALHHEGDIAGLAVAHPAAFLTPAVGSVTGGLIDYRNQSGHQRIVSTTDGGRTWRIGCTTTP